MATENARRIKVLAFMESRTVSGPAKNLIEFAKAAAQPEDGRPGVDITLATFHRPGAPEDFIRAAETAGLPVIVIPEKRAWDAGVLPRLRAAIAEAAPDILQTHNIKSHFLVKWLGAHRTTPWLVFHHGYTTTDAKMRLYNQLDRYSLPSAHRVVTVCQAFARDLVRMGVAPGRITVQHNMIQPFSPPADGQLDSLRSTLGFRNGLRVLLCIGRFSKEKGHSDLIRAAARLHQDSPAIDFRLVLVGDGPEKERVERISRELGLGERVIFAGYQRDVSAYYALADEYVLASHSEGSPNALMEAMAAGVPSLATRVGGVPEIAVHENNAWLVQKGDTAEMARGMARLLLDSNLRRTLSENGRRITETCDPAAYRRHLVGIYQNLVKTAAN